MYYSKNGGCLLISIILILIILVLGFFTRLLFTPAGLTIALLLVGYYFITNKSKPTVNDEEVEIKNNDAFNESGLNDEEFNRDAEDVNFTKID
jgi:hypothetical protein